MDLGEGLQNAVIFSLEDFLTVRFLFVGSVESGFLIFEGNLPQFLDTFLHKS